MSTAECISNRLHEYMYKFNICYEVILFNLLDTISYAMKNADVISFLTLYIYIYIYKEKFFFLNFRFRMLKLHEKEQRNHSAGRPYIQGF